MDVIIIIIHWNFRFASAAFDIVPFSKKIHTKRLVSILLFVHEWMDVFRITKHYIPSILLFFWIINNIILYYYHDYYYCCRIFVPAWHACIRRCLSTCASLFACRYISYDIQYDNIYIFTLFKVTVVSVYIFHSSHRSSLFEVENCLNFI